MPRKRATRATKAKPKVPPKNEIKDTGMSDEEKKDRYDVFMRDFNVKVKDQMKKLERDKQNIMRLIDQKFMFELSKIPTVVRKMKLEDFIACGGTIDAATTYLEEQEDSGVQSTALLSASKMHSKMSRIQPHIFETISEEGSDPTFTQPRTSVRKLKRAQATPSMHGMMTPIIGQSKVATGWETPLVTPKFDPRLPLTGAMKRAAKPGEIIMSMGGSPLENPTIRGKGNIRRRGKTLTIDVDPHTELENVVIPENLSKSQVTQLMGVLQNFIKKAKE